MPVEFENGPQPKRPALDAEPSQLWNYIGQLEGKQGEFWQCLEAMQGINRELAKRVAILEATKADRRRSVIELAAAYAMNNGTVDGLSAETATSWAVHAGFELWEKLDQRFKREQQESKADDNPGD